MRTNKRTNRKVVTLKTDIYNIEFKKVSGDISENLYDSFFNILGRIILFGINGKNN